MSIETNNKLVGKLGSSNIKGSGISAKGETGNGIDKIEKTNSVGLIDTYTIYFTDGNTTTFTIKNGKNGIDGVNGENGENGKSLQFNWNGTQLGIKTEDSTEYVYVDLKGSKGDTGEKGDPGEVTLEQLNTIKPHIYHLNVTSTISANTNFTIPCYYKVGENVLDVYYMGERLIRTTDDIEGNYKEIGETGSISNIIQLDGWSAGDLTDIAEYFEFVVRR